MPAPWREIFELSAIALSSVFFSVDAIGSIPAFLVMGAGANEPGRRRNAKLAALTTFFVLTAFAAAGTLIFRFFGITLPAFRIAGGLLLFQLAMEMLQAKRSGTQEVEAERIEGQSKDEFGVIPMGIPMLAGPAAISAVMVLIAQSRQWWQTIPVYGAIVVTAVSSYLILGAASRVQRYLGESGLRIMVRMMGLVLAAMAVQFIINGISDQWPWLLRAGK